MALLHEDRRFQRISSKKPPILSAIRNHDCLMLFVFTVRAIDYEETTRELDAEGYSVPAL
jgi:hypothetical protein